MQKPLFSWRILSLSVLTSGVLTIASPAYAQWDPRCYSKMADGSQVATIQGFECIMQRVLNIAVSFIGLASFIMFIVGAFLFLTSGGSPKGAEAGRNTMTYAIIGIIIALLAAFILRFVAGFTGVGGILNFNLFLQ